MENTLFFDGQCSLCAHEMALLERWKNSKLRLVDIHSEHCAEIAGGLSRNALLSILHLKRSDGSWATGLDATVSAWRHTPFGWLLTPLRWPLIKRVADSLYLRWAQKRACRLGYSDTCQTSEFK